MSNEKSKEEIRKKFQELDKDLHAAKIRAVESPTREPFDIERITLEAKNDLRKFRKKL